MAIGDRHSHKKSFLISSVVVLVSLAALNLWIVDSSYKALFMEINGSIFEPVLYLSLAITVASIIMLFCSSEVFKLWFSSIFRWFLPIALVLTFLSDPQSSFTFPDRAGVAALFGELLVLVTIIFALVQKFYYKR